ncbi:hypothetical protein P4530_24630 [Bacillus thuringiensis]|nr:hypothetical protein [Bacillus thuringiensis]
MKKIVSDWKEKLIIKYKLGGLLSVKYNGSPYAMINDVYPDYFKEWEFKMTPINYWTKAKALEALKWTIEEKEKLKDNELLEVYGIRWLSNHKLNSSRRIFWKGIPQSMINELYRERFKEWQFKKTRSNWWTRQKALKALKWLIEEREKMDD